MGSATDCDEDNSDGSDQPVSLDQLSQTFARLFAQAEAVAPPSGSPEIDAAASSLNDEFPLGPTASNATTWKPPEWAAEPDSRDLSPKSIVEAMLFVGDPGNAPLTAEQAAALMRGVCPEDVHRAVKELNERYLERRRPCHIVSEGAGYRLVLRPEYRRLRDKYQGKVRQARLSQAAIEALAVVAYNGPVTCEEVSRHRGASSSGVLAQLVRRQLLSIERSEDKPRDPQYRTTPRFLDLFGLDSLFDLPRSQEAEAT